jgi:uncharacterized protein (DUF302 family)
MRQFIAAGLAAGFLMVAAAISPASADTNMVVRPSANDIVTTVEKFEAAASKAGLKIFGRIDYGNGMMAVLFGNAALIGKILETDPAVGTSLPFKFVVWKDDYDGTVYAGYDRAAYTQGRHNLGKFSKDFSAYRSLANKLAGAATK